MFVSFTIAMYLQVLGNRDMKLKYLNSNLVFVISSSVVQAEEPSLHVQLIDTVSGQMLYSQSLQVKFPHEVSYFTQI